MIVLHQMEHDTERTEIVAVKYFTDANARSLYWRRRDGMETTPQAATNTTMPQVDDCGLCRIRTLRLITKQYYHTNDEYFESRRIADW